MAAHNHSVVWIDHHEARIFHFSADEVDSLTVRPNDPHVHIHHKANAIGSGHSPEDKAFLSAVVDAIGGSKAILITGPGVAKTALVKHIARYAPTMMAHVAGVETVDHPADGVLIAHARTYFKDRRPDDRPEMRERRMTPLRRTRALARDSGPNLRIRAQALLA